MNTKTSKQRRPRRVTPIAGNGGHPGLAQNPPDAATIARQIQNGDIGAQWILERQLERIESEESRLNAFVTIDADAARETARERDAEQKRGQSRGPLHGVPIAFKDSWATRGLRTTNGFPATEEQIPDFDATVVARLKAAGAIVVGKTNLSALALDVQSDNSVAGRTNNPHDTQRTPGGSSGGAAAAVAAGLVPFDIGSDIGGSIRLPAHFCGVLGFKPTENAVSLFGHLPGLPQGGYVALRNLASAGPIARSFADLRLAFDLIRGPDPRDAKIAPVSPASPASHRRMRPMRVAILPPAPGMPLDAEYFRRIGAFIDRLRHHKKEFELIELEAAPFDYHELGVLWGKLLNAGLAPITPAPARAAMALFSPGAKKRSAGAEQIFPLRFAEYMRVFTKRDRAIEAFETFFAHGPGRQGDAKSYAIDALVAPVSATAAFEHRRPDRTAGPTNLYTRPVMIAQESGGDFAQEYYRAQTGYTVPFNLLGNPAVSIPIDRMDSGLPVGVQVIGPRWGDLDLLERAERIYEAATAPVAKL